MSLLLVSIEQWILPAILLVFVVGLFIFNYVRNKKYQDNAQNMVSSLKKGDKVKTYSGIYGKIVEIKENADGSKVVTIQTGTTKNTGYFSIDINAIYSIVDEQAKVAPVAETEPAKDLPAQETVAPVEEVKAEKLEEETKTEPVEEKPKTTKKAKTTPKAKTTKK